MAMEHGVEGRIEMQTQRNSCVSSGDQNYQSQANTVHFHVISHVVL